MRSFLSSGKNILLSNFQRLPFPYKITFTLTYWCNYKCKTCNIWQRQPKDELSLKEIETFFRKSNRFNWIDFTGGEVWLRADFVDIVRLAIRYCSNLHYIHFPTNGYLTERIADGVKEILKHKPRKLSITVSLDGDEKTNDFIRGKEGGFQRQIETFKFLRELRGQGLINTSLGMTLSAMNQGRFEDTFNAVKKHIPDLNRADFHINIAQVSNHYFGNTTLDQGQASPHVIHQDIENFSRKPGKKWGLMPYIKETFYKLAPRYLDSGQNPVRCQALNASCFIDPWGQVYPCSMYDLPLGSLRDHHFDLTKIWNLPKTRKYQREIWDLKCPNCWTACDAYPSLLGNLLGQNKTVTKRKKLQPAIDSPT